MRVSLLEPKGIIWEGSAKEAALPGEDGEVCVLDFHQPFLVRLKKGVISLGNRQTPIKDGIAFMKGNVLKIFVET